jgi:hypothetical protein
MICMHKYFIVETMVDWVMDKWVQIQTLFDLENHIFTID